jgi:hypothetical protein
VLNFPKLKSGNPPQLVPMKITIILAIAIAAIAACSVAVYFYLRIEFQRVKRSHADRAAEILATPKFMALSADQQLSLRGYFIKKMDGADRKRILFSTLSNMALTVGGVAPIIAILAPDPDIQKVLNAVSSVSVLCLGIFSLEKYSIEHRRTGYLMDSLIQEWISEVGTFGELSDGDAFRLLIRKAKEILDTGETSFIGAGTQPNTAVMPVPTVESFHSIPEWSPAPEPLPPPPEPEGIPIEELLDWSTLGDVVTQSGVRVAPEDFAAWQANALGNSGGQK